MIQTTIQADQIKQLAEAIKGTPRKLKRELAAAVNATAKKTKTIMAREIAKELIVARKEINDKVSATAAKGNASEIVARVRVSKTGKISLKRFNARQTASGVAYKASKSRGARTIPNGFMGPKPGTVAMRLGGHAFVRKGKARLPIIKLHGPSPWGVFVAGGRREPSVEQSQAELQKQIDRRIKFINLKKQGTI
jgi:hypothetical protein